MAVTAKPVAAAGSKSRFWRAPMLESLPLKLSVLVICFLWTVPTAGLLVTSFRNPELITKTGWWEGLFNLFGADQWTLRNYEQVLGGEGMFEAFLNSLIVTVPSTVIPITIAAFAAYAFAWIPFRGRGILFTIVVALLVVPLQMALIPILKIYSGASLFQTFIRIVLPLSVPALGAFAIFQFLWVWNDLLVALVFLGPGGDVRVMPTQLYLMLGPRGGAWHLLTAGAFVTMVVPLVVFLALQRFFVRGILAGSVK
jgi:alpha-glucoside transport system permease protein